MVLHIDDLVQQGWNANISRCSFSMMVRWAKDGLLQSNASKMLVIDGEMIVAYTHFTIITSILQAFAHLTIIKKLHRLQTCDHPYRLIKL